MTTLTNPPAAVEMPDNPLDIRKKRLIFRSWHRGTREMDLIMGRFADRHVPGFDGDQLDQYERLLSCPDPDVYDWVSGRTPPPEEEKTPVLELLLAFRLA